MTRKRTAKKQIKKKMPPIYKYGIITIAFFFLLFLYLYFNPSYKTQVCYSGVEEEIISTRGIIVLDEEILKSQSKGFALMNYADGTRVGAKTHVATLYTGEVDEGKQNSIRDLNEKINSLDANIKNKNNNSKSGDNTNAILLNKMKRISYYNVKGDFQAVRKEASEISGLTFSESSSSPEKQLESLITKRNDIEHNITGKSSIFNSTTSGILFSKLDGYETIYTKETTKDVTTKVFDTLYNAKPIAYEKSQNEFIFGKIVNNYEVAVLAEVNQKDIAGIEDALLGKTSDERKLLYLASPDLNGGKIPAVTTNISVPQDGKCILTLKVSKNIEGIMKTRKLKFDLVKNTYSGIRIPKLAIMTDANGVNSVFVVKDGVVKRKTVDLIYQENEFVIAKENNLKDQNILLYDLVLTKAKNVTEGMIVQDKR